MSIITISRQAGSLGNEIADLLSKKLGWELLTREKIITEFFDGITNSNDLNMLRESAKFYLHEFKEKISYLEYLRQRLREYASSRSVVIVGSGSQIIFSDNPDALHIRIVAPENIRTDRIKRQYRVNTPEAEEIRVQSDRKHRKFVSTVFEVDLTDESLYHMILNTAYLSSSDCASIIHSLHNEIENNKNIEKQAECIKAINNPDYAPVLKNPSEFEFAKILDMYQIEWKYEPKTFPIEWDAEGNVSLAFSPDFYLTKFDTYIELTTMTQKYITKKNKKMKKLRELYPGINIKIVNKKDFNILIERFRPTIGGD